MFAYVPMYLQLLRPGAPGQSVVGNAVRTLEDPWTRSPPLMPWDYRADGDDVRAWGPETGVGTR